MIIGVSGKNCAGKDVFADYLVSKGFVCYSLSDVIRDESRKEGIEITRENLIKKGNELRNEFGAGILAEKIKKKLEQGKNYVITSIRNPAEIQELKKQKNFMLIAVDAPIEIRFERERERDREGGVKTLKEFRALEEKELKGTEKSQQLNMCIKLADKVITNNSTLGEFHKKIDELLKDEQKKT